MIKPSLAPSIKEKFALIVFGIVVGVILLELGLRLGGWAFLSLQEHKNKVVSKDKDAYRILCLGESTTALSTELDEGESSYPSQLQEILNHRNPGKKYVVINAGVSGITTTGILRQLPDNLSNYSPHMVITMMGINDRGNILPYENMSLPWIVSFLREYRVYKLACLLWSHGLSKLSELEGQGGFSLDELLSVKFKKEEAKLKKAVELNSGNADVYLELGGYYLDLAMFRKAEEMFKQTIKTGPDNDKAYLELGKCYAETARFKEAEELFLKSITINPQNYEAYCELTRYYLHEGRFQELEKMLRKGIERDPENGKIYFLLGLYYMYVKKDQEAEDILVKAVKRNPKNYYALLALGIHYSDTARFQEAATTYDRFDAIEPKTYNAYVELGYCYLQVGKYRKGEELLLKAIAIAPRNPDPYRYLGYDCYSPQERYQEAENILKKAIAMNPESPEAYMALGQFYINEGRYPQAAKIFSKAIKAGPGNHKICGAFDAYETSPRSLRAYTTFGVYYFRAARFQEAESIFRKILEINSRNYDLYLQLGSCYKAAGRLREAEGILTKAIEINPGESRAYFRLGCVYTMEARYQEAKQAWLKGLEKNPGNYYIRSQLEQDPEIIPSVTRSKEAGEISEEVLRLETKNFMERSDRLSFYKKATIDNYRKLRETVLQRGIKLMVVQYPCRNIRPLKNIFKDTEGIIFVDNEGIFKRALQQGTYSEYFWDRFGGDFGHCTRMGNRLLAENIAKSIIEAGY